MSVAYLHKARELAQEAARTVLQLSRQPLTTARKKDKSLVTNADLKSDEILKNGLLKNFPDHAILTEESGLMGREGSDWIWMIDPLDGTKAYEKGIPGYSVMVGLLKEGRPYLGIVVDPLEDLTYEAVRGEGARLTAKGKKTALHVSTRRDFQKMPLVTSSGFPPEKFEKIKDFLKGPVCPPMNSVGIKVGLVVRQLADIYINHHRCHYWDTCAPQIILEEAGGRFTFMDGTDLRYSLDGTHEHQALTLVTNGTRHEELVKILSQIDFK